MQQSLDADATDLQWIVDSYAIVFAGLLLTAGAIGDRFGRKLSLMGGLLLFAFGSLLGALADTSNMVIVARAISGIGAAFVMPATLSLLSAIFPPQERGKAIAIWAGFAGAGGALGPVLVGFLLTGWWIFPSFWWGSAFVVNVVTSLAVVIAIADLCAAEQGRRVDAARPGRSGPVADRHRRPAVRHHRGTRQGVGRRARRRSASCSPRSSLVVFIVWERRTEHPMLPMRLFRNRRFSTGSGVITFGFMVMFGFFFLITQYFQFVRGWSPLRAGLANLPFAFTMILVSPRSDGFVRRFGMNWVIGAGFTSMTAGFVLLALLTPSTPYLVIVVGLVLLSSGMAMTIAPATGAIMSSVPLNKAGVGSAVNDTTRELGGALGIAVLGSIVASSYRGEFDASGLPPEVQSMAGESIGGAIRVASQLGGPEAAALVEQAGVAFTECDQRRVPGVGGDRTRRRDDRARIRAGHPRRRPTTRGDGRGMSGVTTDAPAELDPRIERTRRVVFEATLDELAELGYGALTIEGVARRAGVGKATIYRHWDGKLDLVADAVTTLKEAVRPPETDDHRERIGGMISALAEHLAGSRFSACMPALIEASERDPAVREFHHRTSAERRALMVGLLDDARAAGHLPVDIDTALLAELLVGPIFLRKLTSPTPFPPDQVDELLAMVLDPHWRPCENIRGVTIRPVSQIYLDRLARVRAAMAEQGVDALLLSVGHDLPYLTGYLAMPLERLTMLVVPRDGDATLVIPRLEAPRVEPQPGVFELLPWDETEDPTAIVARLAAGAGTIAVGDQMWARFLVELLPHLPARDVPACGRRGRAAATW